MAAKDKVFLDTDIALDHLTGRLPFAEFAHRVLALAELREIELWASALSFANLYYLLRKSSGHAVAVARLAELRRIVDVAPASRTALDAALASKFGDFEDALQYFAAKEAGNVTVILTRNKPDYAGSELPVMSAEEYLQQRESRRP
jgi:predicted nucleic acid-binding protein